MCGEKETKTEAIAKKDHEYETIINGDVKTESCKNCGYVLHKWEKTYCTETDYQEACHVKATRKKYKRVWTCANTKCNATITDYGYYCDWPGATGEGSWDVTKLYKADGVTSWHNAKACTGAKSSYVETYVLTETCPNHYKIVCNGHWKQIL